MYWEKLYYIYNSVAFGVTDKTVKMWLRSHRLKSWKQLLAKMQAKIVYNKSL